MVPRALMVVVSRIIPTYGFWPPMVPLFTPEWHVPYRPGQFSAHCGDKPQQTVQVLGGSSSSSGGGSSRTSHPSNVKKPRRARERAVQPPPLKEGGVEPQWPAVVQVGVPTPTAKRHTRGFATNRAAIATGPAATPMEAPPAEAAAAAAAAAHNLQTVRGDVGDTGQKRGKHTYTKADQSTLS